MELHALVQAVLADENVQQSAERMSARIPGPPAEQLLSSPFLLFGSPERMTDALQERRERFGLSHFTVFEPVMEALAPVVARLAGR